MTDVKNKRSIPMVLKGIGYRVRLTESQPDPEKGVEMSFEVGFSHPVVLRLRSGIQVVMDQTGTSFTLKATHVDACSLGQEADRLMKRRSRSPYTGVGILRGDRVYPKLKSTKKAAKKA